ncbi:MAG: porin family protein [Bacteroidetes bacterium]|nr:porin family protein [Bacteroidota bacterium]
MDQKKRLTSSVLLLTAMLLLAGSAHSQRRKPENQPKYDLNPYHFGFILGMNQMFFTVKTVKDFDKQDTIFAVNSLPEMGFNIGIVSNLRLADYWDLRFIPTLSFGERTMVFTRALHDTLYFDTPKKVESTLLEFPLEVKFKSKRLYNSRAYLLTGIKYTMDLASQAKKKEQDEEIRIKLKKNDFAFEFGVGFDFYATFFKFGTELKMSYGFNDLLKHENNVFAGTIDRLNSKIFQFTFTFE